MPEPTATQVHIDSTLDEQRTFEPPAEFSQKAQIKSLGIRSPLQRIGRAAGEILGPRRRGTALVQEVGQGSGVESPLGQVVRRRRDQYFLQLSGSPRADGAQEQSGTDLGE